MPCYFLFAFVFTALMLERVDRIIALFTEYVIYIGACLVAYYKPETVTPLETETAFAVDVIMSFAITGVLLFMVITLYIRIYINRQKQLEEVNERLHKLYRTKTEFYNKLAHDILTPLTRVSTNIQVANAMPEKAAELLPRSQKDIMLMAEMINNALEESSENYGEISEVKPEGADL